MEEVWKDIAINSVPSTPIHQHIIHNNIHHPTPNNNSHFKGGSGGGLILQDFFSNQQSTITSSHIMPPQLRPPPTTEFQFLESQQFHQIQGNHSSSSSSVPGLITAADDPFDALASSSLLTSFGTVATPPTNHKKRVSEGDDSAPTALDDRRHKRMIKNRESAARSRARKQAYITELELEVKSLMKENAMLRKQQRQMQLNEAPATQLPKKNGLHRTKTF